MSEQRPPTWLTHLLRFGVGFALALVARPEEAVGSSEAAQTKPSAVSTTKKQKRKKVRQVCVPPHGDVSGNAKGRCLPKNGECPYDFVVVNTAEPVGSEPCARFDLPTEI